MQEHLNINGPIDLRAAVLGWRVLDTQVDEFQNGDTDLHVAVTPLVPDGRRVRVHASSVANLLAGLDEAVRESVTLVPGSVAERPSNGYWAWESERGLAGDADLEWRVVS